LHARNGNHEQRYEKSLEGHKNRLSATTVLKNIAESIMRMIVWGYHNKKKENGG